MAPTSTRRISYIVPSVSSPSNSVPKLSLPSDGTPRNGQIGPILLPAKNSGTDQAARNAKKTRYPRHRLGVAAFALDTATQLVGRDSPEGILYSGGRDGMVMAWDLGLPMKPRASQFSSSVQSGSHRMGRWERLTIDEEDENAIYEEEDDDWPTSDGDVIGDVLESGGRRGSRYWTKQGDIPYEQRWEIDVDCVEPGQPAYWRKHTQSHTDWVNDILLCNLNQTVVSGSSDGTVKAWNPHSSVSSPPSTIGTHSDYVRCLAQCHERKWIASGSFDRTVKLWDMSQPRADPLMTLVSPESVGPKSSVYALASDPFGHVVAAGGPERVIRTWDPRSGKRTGKLVGHTDNIRAILMSEDSRYLLTGSADASIKLWSILSPQRCIYTFTHHTESVWSLFSSHPALEVFYSGDRSGLVCRVDVEECERAAQGECIVLCKDSGEPSMASSEGVSKIIAMDDHLVWTASGSSSIRRWRVPQGRIARATSTRPLDEPSSPFSLNYHTSFSNLPRAPSSPEGPSLRRLKGESMTPSITASLISQESSEFDAGDSALNGIPYESLVKLSAPNTHHGPFSISRGREAEVATLYSAASVRSVSRQGRSPSAGAFPSHAYAHSQGHVSIGAYGSGSGRRDTLGPPVQDGVPFASPNARMAYEDRDVAPDATPLVAEPDLLIEGEHGLVRVLIMNDRMHALTVNTAGLVAVWDIVRCQCLGVFAQEDVHNANRSAASSLASGGDGVSSAAARISPRQALEIVRDRIEGEAVINPWSNADTRIGELTIHILDRCFESEIFADEAGYGSERSYSDDHRLNIGKWVLRNLFMGFIREEQRLAAKNAHEKSIPSAYRGTHSHRSHGSSHPRSLSDSSAGDRTPGSFIPSDVPPVPALPVDVAPGMSLSSQGLSPIAQSPVGSVVSDALPTPRPVNYAQPDLLGMSSAAGVGAPGGNPAAGLAGGAPSNPVSSPASATPSAATASASHDYFSLRRRPSTSHSASTTQMTAGLAEDDFSGWGGPGSAKSSTAHDVGPSTPSTPGGGLMGRLKSLGKSARRAATEVETPPASGHSTADTGEGRGEEQPLSPSSPKTLIERLKSQPITPPSSNEAPLLSLPSETAVVVSEESSSGWAPVYRGTVGSAGTDAPILEEVLPEWLLEFLLANKAPPVPVTKISFVLLPALIPADAKELYGETLPELLNSSQSKLSASRFLRVKKLAYHVQEKLDKNLQSKPSSPRSSTDTNNAGRGSLSLGTSSSPEGTSSPATSRASTPRLSPNMQLHGHGHGLPRAEDVYEILCNDQVLSLDMTLAAARQFIWRQSGELVMHYRRKPRRAPIPELAVSSGA